MDQPVLMHPHVHEGTEVGHVGHDARQLHPRLQVLHLLDARLEREHLKLLARIAAGLGEFAENVGQGRQAHRFGDVFW